MIRPILTATFLTAALGMASMPGASAAGPVCDAGLESSLAALARGMGAPLIRVQIKTKVGEGQDRAAIDRTTQSLAAALKQAGAHTADPIDGQPLLVAELGKQQLLRLAQDPRIACVTPDLPDAPN
ncbi:MULTISPECIES: hypothetical protein [Rhodomicrobium]|uniref:hypothetical protein n=1 Tax=Rhodomicrobium TaxID=1068 RepID=UPI000B4A879F|nr:MULTISPECIES: hypothetical protein [Rhodomicrobium]